MDLRLIPAEDLGTRVLVIGEPVTILLYQLQVPAGIEDLLKVPGRGGAGTVSLACPQHRTVGLGRKVRPDEAYGTL